MKRIILISLLLISSAFAHLDGGEDRIINDYLIDFGFSPENPVINDEVTLAFNLINNTTKEIIEPISVWIRISSPQEVMFAGTLHPEAEHVTFVYAFPETNNYEITVRFKDNADTLVETSFKLNVSDNTIKIEPLLGYKLTFILGIINIISLLLIIFSCKCLVGIKFLKRMWKYKIYQKYCRLHCYYWWIFLISVILHTIIALITFGIPI